LGSAINLGPGTSAFAAENGWRVVRRLGGRQIEFYNDARRASAQLIASNHTRTILINRERRAGDSRYC